MVALASTSAAERRLVQSAQSGPWSAPATWAGGKVPEAGASVQIRPGHAVTYDIDSTEAIRAIFIAGALRFAPDRDTRLEVGLIKVQAGNDTSEDGFNCDAHLPAPDPSQPLPALEVGTWDQPVAAAHSALIRLVYFEGMDKQSCPAIVCCGGRMEFHGAEMDHTWVKLGATVQPGDNQILLADAVTGWKAGDHIFLTGNVRQRKHKVGTVIGFKTRSVRMDTQTEERTVKEVRGTALVMDKPMEFAHEGEGDYRSEVANLSRNVVVESAANGELRGHTMYHRDSQGSISYAEFRHLGKEGVLGRYAIHFHLVRDTMRGSSVIGASIWDSDNRWITIHGSDYLVVRDCVGYQSTGHGFFLEDGTESFNVLDHNLAVQACIGNPLPKQVLAFDKNEGAGFWWANCGNTFTRNVAAECDEYGYRFEAIETPELSMTMQVPQPDGTRTAKDIRTIPFVRFEGNEAHCQRRHSFNIGGIDDMAPGLSVDGIGSDARHPFIVRDCKAWNVHWAMHSHSSFLMIDGLTVHSSEYGLWRMNYEECALHNIKFDNIEVKTDFAPYKATIPAEADYPKPLDPVDDQPPFTMITRASRQADGAWQVRGTTTDNGTVKRVDVNGCEAHAVRANFAEWEATVPARLAKTELRAFAEDAAGNIEPKPNVISCDAAPPVETASAKEVEWLMVLGCRHCHFAEQTGLTTCKGTCGPAASRDGEVFALSGNGIPKDFKKSGKWLVKGTLSADGKTIAVKEMEARNPSPAELKNDPPAAAAAGAKSYAGAVSHSGQGLPILTTADNTRYNLKAAKSASVSTGFTLTRIGGGELTGAYAVLGATYEDDSHKWIVVESIQAGGVPPPP
jgi:hypothetical protein